MFHFTLLKFCSKNGYFSNIQLFVFISQDNLHITAKYDHILCINSTSIKKKWVIVELLAIYFCLEWSRWDSTTHGGHKPPTIARLLREEGVKVSCVGIWKFLAKFQETGSIGRRIGSRGSLKITAERKKLVEDLMQSDIEIMVYQLHKLLTR